MCVKKLNNLFCHIYEFLSSLQDDLDALVDMWDTHSIRRSTNEEAATGQPNLLFGFPEHFDTEDYLVGVATDIQDQCSELTTPKGTIPCADEDMFELCVLAMAEANLDKPKDSDDAYILYSTIRPKVRGYLTE